MRVAIAYGPDGPLALEDVPTPALGAHDVLVRVAASGICHTDITAIGNLPAGAALVPGHEGCGQVEAVGSEVRRVKAGDRVLASVSPACGQCWWCTNGASNHCERKPLMQQPRVELPDGRRVPALCGLGTFSETMVVNEASVVAVDTALPDEQLALLGCGVTTGLGAALRTAHVEPGSSVAVIGCGGVGQAVIQGARLSGAATIIAIDPAPGRRDTALALGATDAVDPSAADPVEQVKGLTGGRGVDHSFEVVGHPDLMVQAFRLARDAGSVTLVGMPGRDAVFTMPAMELIFTGKRVRGSVMGGSQILQDYPRYLRLAETGQLELAAMVTRRIKLDEVNDGLAALHRAEGIRTVIVN